MCSRGERLNRRQMGTAMTRYGQIGWRMVAIAAFVGTAALAVALTRAPAQDGAHALFGCLRPRLRHVRARGVARARRRRRDRRQPVKPGSATGAQGTYYTLEFTNVSDRACSLFGYPEVSAYRDSAATGAGGPIGGAGGPRHLDPAEAGHARARGDGARRAAGRPSQPASCAKVTAEELRVTLPRQDRPAIVPAHIPVCSQKGQRIAERAGHPGPAGRPRLHQDALRAPPEPGQSSCAFGRNEVLSHPRRFLPGTGRGQCGS